MKQILDCANGYVKARDWKMVAALKFCVASLGAIGGLLLPTKHKKAALTVCLTLFFTTYIPLVADFLTYALDFFKAREENKA